MRVRALLLSWLVLGACDSVTKSRPEVLGIAPSTVRSAVATDAVITGTGFYTEAKTRVDRTSAPRLNTDFAVELTGAGATNASESYSLDATFVDTETLEVTIPAGLAEGLYHVAVITPGGARGTLDSGLTVVGQAVTVSIENAAGGSGQPIGLVLDLTTDTTLDLWAAGRDALGNWVADLEVRWSLIGDIGSLDTGPAPHTALDLTRPGDGNVVAQLEGFAPASAGPLVVGVGAQAAVRVESAPGGTGAAIGDLTLEVGTDVPVYALAYDADGNRLDDAPEDVTWSVTGDAIGTLVPAGPASSSVLQLTANGTGQVLATPVTGESDSTGNITVIAGAATHVVIEDAAGGTGAAVDALTLTTDDSDTFHAIARDAAGNFVRNATVTWGWTAACDLGGLVGNLTAPSVTFQPADVGACTLEADHATLTDDQTGTVTVNAGALAEIRIEDGLGGAPAALALTSGGTDCTGVACGAGCGSCTLVAEGYDADGNGRGPEAVDWALTDAIGSVSPTSGSSTAITGIAAGIGSVQADLAGFGFSPDASVGVTVLPGVLASIEIENDNGDPIPSVSLIANGSVQLFVSGRDAADNEIAIPDCSTVTWSTTDATGTIGTLSPNTGVCATTLTADAGAATGEVHADTSMLGGSPDDTIAATVVAGSVENIYVSLTDSGPCQNWTGGGRTTDDTITLWAIGCDSTDNYLAAVPADWSVLGIPAIGVLTATTNVSSTTLVLDAPGTGQVQATTGPDTGTTGPIVVTVGQVSYVLIENESGDNEDPLVRTAGDAPVVLTAIGYDADDNQVGAQTVQWQVQDPRGTIGMFTGAQITFTPTVAGDGQITADHATAADDQITTHVDPDDATSLVLEDAPDGLPIGTVTLYPDDEIVVYACGRDEWGNYTGLRDVSWSITGDIGPLLATTSTTATFAATLAGSGEIIAVDDLNNDNVATAGPIEVRAGPVVRVYIEPSAGGGPLNEMQDQRLAVGEVVDMFAVGRDAYDNFALNLLASWQVEPGSAAIGSVNPTTGTDTQFTALAVGNGLVRAGPTDSTLVDDTVIIDVFLENCGNGVIEGDEECDSGNLGGETCWSQGYLAGGGLRCDGGCKLDTSLCGDRIDRWTVVQTAVAEVYAVSIDAGQHHTISIVPTSYNATSQLILDECDGSVCSDPVGLTLQSLPGKADIRSAIDAGGFEDTPVIEVISGRNVIRGLGFSLNSGGIRLNPGPGAGGNLITHNRFTVDAGGTFGVITVESPDNRIEANAIVSSKELVGAGITVASTAQRTEIGMNLIDGPFTFAISVAGSGPAAASTYIDHNSVRLYLGNNPFGATLTGVRLDGVRNFCYRNNIIYGDGLGTIGIALVNTVTLGNTCAPISGANVNLNHFTACSGLACADLCGSTILPRPLCDRQNDPGFVDPWLCLNPASNPLINSGRRTGIWDMWDDPGDFNLWSGSNPEVGAREHGVTRVFGGTPSDCD